MTSSLAVRNAQNDESASAWMLAKSDPSSAVAKLRRVLCCSLLAPANHGIWILYQLIKKSANSKQTLWEINENHIENDAMHENLLETDENQQ